ncbi:MAG: DUF362 domain-containing protein [Phycisphaerae bacterium]
MSSAPPEVFLARPRVGIAVGPSSYAAQAPFSPSERYPEYPHADGAGECGLNHAYASVRRALQLLGCDAQGFGSAEWNPLGEILGPGDSVVLKPNFIRDFRETHPGHADCLITHGSVIRAVLDYVYIALKGRGRVVVADSPQNDADFQAIRRIVGLDEIQDFYSNLVGFEIAVHDLRPEQAKKIDGVIVGHERLSGDPAGYVKVNLGLRSAFAPINDLCHLLYGSEYDTSELHSHQHDDVHEYLIAKTILEAGCVISLPKLKTHKKTGITINMKNLVGINGNKNWLPHHREGTPGQGGDQFADDGLKHRMERVTLAGFKRVFPFLGALRPVVAGPIKALGKRVFGDTNTDTIRSGNWYGNDTTWRMVIDLNRILQYADVSGTLHDRPVRRFFSVVDGIVAGEGNGPLDPTPKAVGLAVAGYNPVAVDLACVRLMGFDYQRLPVLQQALDEHPLPLAPFAPDDVVVESNDQRLCGPVRNIREWNEAFEPHFGWKGHVEAGSCKPAEEDHTSCVA